MKKAYKKHSFSNEGLYQELKETNFIKETKTKFNKKTLLFLKFENETVFQNTLVKPTDTNPVPYLFAEPRYFKDDKPNPTVLSNQVAIDYLLQLPCDYYKVLNSYKSKIYTKPEFSYFLEEKCAKSPDSKILFENTHYNLIIGINKIN